MYIKHLSCHKAQYLESHKTSNNEYNQKHKWVDFEFKG